jgi:hypothetical protein
MRNTTFIALLALTALSIPSQAKITKHWVLKQIVNGGVAQYIAFNSPQECEFARRRWIAGMAKLKLKFRNQVGFTLNADGICLDYIPLDYKIMR